MVDTIQEYNREERVAALEFWFIFRVPTTHCAARGTKLERLKIQRRVASCTLHDHRGYSEMRVLLKKKQQKQQRKRKAEDEEKTTTVVDGG
jgi:hypothetical protein